ncbi:MAG: hypothetical protein PHS26_02045 [Actinomycetota bacterium]|nr:hypothetical protein [Actinomycetota bacterium]
MEASGCAGNADPAKRAGKAVKWAFVIGLAVAAAVIGFLTIFRTHPAQTTVREAMAAVEQGDAEALMSHVDPEGDLGRLWTENTQGARDAILDALERYRVEFSSPRFATRAEGSAAEVALKGGRVTVYRRGGEESTLAVFDLEEGDLVFYVEKRGEDWLIRGLNYDILEFLSGDMGFLPL